MKISRATVPVLSALAMLAGGAPVAAAGQAKPCVELRLKGGYEMTIPCPEGLDEVLSLFLPRKRPGERRDFAIDPDPPDDREMAKDPDWPHDEDMVRRPNGHGSRPPSP